MISLNSALYIGRDALMTQQLSISVTGQNIANVDTAGYCRQRVNLESKSIQTSQGNIGTGVMAKGVVRIYDQFLNAGIQEEIQQKGRWQAQSRSMQQVEIVFDESSDYGLSRHMGQFWDSWQALTLNPSGYAQRNALVTSSENLAFNFQEKFRSLEQVQKDMDVQIVAAVGEINALASQVASLNTKIQQLEMGGGTANALRDQREVLIRQLSEKINFSTREDAAGRVTLTLGDGRDLVGNPPFGKLTTAENADGYHDLQWDTVPPTSIDNQHVTAGNLSGWMKIRDSLVPEYKDKLDLLARQIINQVNEIHRQGQGLDGATGNDFFSGNSASTLQVNPDIVDHVEWIAAAGGSGPPESIGGDNTQAMAIAALQNKKTMDGGSATFDTYFNALVSKVGSDVQKASVQLDHYTMTVEQMENYRESVSGVSLDEEMVNLVKYQQGYAAAAKLIDSVREMMDTVLAMV